MKNIFYILLLLPTIIFAQYPSNSGQKITLGEQTTADGLVYRGIRADTTSKIVPFSDTSAYIILDTVEKTLWLYKAGQIPKWQQVGGSAGGSTIDTASMLTNYYRAGRSGIIQAADVPTLNQNTTGSAATLTTARNIRTNLASAFGANFNGSTDITPGVSGVLGAGNGGTGASNFGSPNRIPFVSSSGSLTTDTFFAYNGTTQRLGVGVPNPTEKLHVSGNGLFTGSMSLGTPLSIANGGTGQTTLAAAGINTGSGTLNYLPKYTGATTLQNSLISDNGSTVTITVPTTAFALQLTGPNSRLNMINNSAGSAENYSQMSFGHGGSNGQYAEMIRYNNTKRFSVFNGGGDVFFSTNYVSDYRYDLFVESDNGNVGIGTASPLSKLNVMGTVRINSAAAPDANYYLQLENSSSQKAKANAWDTYSDKRIKTDIQPIVNAIDKVNLLNPVYYQKHDSYVENDFLNIDYDSSVKSLGFIAQEVYNIIPEAVNTGTTNELWAMDYTKIIPILTKAIQEQTIIIKQLEDRIKKLEEK